MRPADNSHDIDGVGQRVTANLSYRGQRDFTRIDVARSELKDNAFASQRKFTDASFESVDDAALTGSRQADGSLPKVAFLRPVDATLGAQAGYTAYPGSQPTAK